MALKMQKSAKKHEPPTYKELQHLKEKKAAKMLLRLAFIKGKELKRKNKGLSPLNIKV